MLLAARACGIVDDARRAQLKLFLEVNHILPHPHRRQSPAKLKARFYHSTPAQSSTKQFLGDQPRSRNDHKSTAHGCSNTKSCPAFMTCKTQVNCLAYNILCAVREPERVCKAAFWSMKVALRQICQQIDGDSAALIGYESHVIPCSHKSSLFLKKETSLTACIHQ